MRIPKNRVELGDVWRAYTASEPYGVLMLGVIFTRARNGNITAGALGRVKSTGRYVEIRGSDIIDLDGRSIAAALGKAGRSQSLRDGRQANLYLDASTIAVAARLGSGNVSLGVRRGMKLLAQQFDYPEATEV